MHYGKDIHEAIENSHDPLELQRCLSAEQLKTLQEYKIAECDRLHSAMREEVERRLRFRIESGTTSKSSGIIVLPGDSIVPLLKVRVVDVQSKKNGVLFIWRPNEDLINSMKENSIVQVINLSTGGTIANELHFKTTKETRFQVGVDITK